MDTKPAPFVPPAPKPRTQPPSTLEMMRIVYRNPLELWGEHTYNEPWISVTGIGGPLVIANDPGLIRHVLIDNAKNYKMATVRQLILRPILRDGLLTAEGEVWKRSRKAMAPVFTPRHIFGFAGPMLKRTLDFVTRYEAGGTTDVARDMTMLTYDILAETLFSGEIAGEQGSFAKEVDRLFETMGRVDPLDLLRAPEWLPRLTRIRGRKTMAYFRNIVANTVKLREERLKRDPDGVPQDFLTLLLKAEGPDGLTRSEVEDNIITFIGAGHETTARALGWTIYCLAEAPWERDRVEREIDAVLAREPDPTKWLDAMPLTRAAFEEALRLYPPAPSINREPIEPETWNGLYIPRYAAVLVMPWVVHRHRKLWDKPDAFMPERFHPENRDRIDRFQYLPFGAGPRVCIGASFAMQEAIIALAVLLSRFRFDVTSETRPWPVQKLTTQPQGGLPMQVSPRG
ncbi:MULTISPECIES: cytochrome P450 [unclassified Mesorhizobium]|uniref:cytochrome P450 n=2 Tax=Mesorhizobium TaxID=68287 RepID=UPI000FCB08A6|nr:MULTISPECIES: cytochrome P450 [unclassified Mesorhizobium]TIT79011.1 MAG: cytochrome P450 [Mesorhizobium sp.]TGP24049.1 cytochrome P450 [Mesorhizobium sp. M1D.F.Ca.ET.231.01.1.1]TGP35364.1 cytochrome P450 [Mesorhizobium sp. M1D.F.Ca.ET.234.01.1.1]TGS49386.1 cytochrome P450 [Mesorhizobium sp. M1D.F.Ca.ET.184.01.1.1]TGS63583.1 cytochrome P450 [Mesorhizobium sp. M1D.F.Ca.ET.183.01.1.1]